MITFKINETTKWALQHQERMRKRPTGRFDVAELSTLSDDKLDQLVYSFPIAIGAKITEFLREDGYKTGMGGVEFPMYYNDTFLPNGKPWFEDVYHDYLKVVIECELGALHIFIDQNERIVLDLIKSSKIGSGNGSKLLTYLLDAIDHCANSWNVKLECVCVPTMIEDTDPNQTTLQLTNRLRNFYLDFKFKPMSPFSAKLIYKAK